MKGIEMNVNEKEKKANAASDPIPEPGIHFPIQNPLQKSPIHYK